MHEAYTALSDKDFQCLRVNFLSVVIPSIKTSSLASTLNEFIFNMFVMRLILKNKNHELKFSRFDLQ